MKYRHLSIEERESLQYMWWERKSIRSMAKAWITALRIVIGKTYKYSPEPDVSLLTSIILGKEAQTRILTA